MVGEMAAVATLAMRHEERPRVGIEAVCRLVASVLFCAAQAAPTLPS